MFYKKQMLADLKEDVITNTMIMGRRGSKLTIIDGQHNQRINKEKEPIYAAD